jgi:hypothetical protein
VTRQPRDATWGRVMRCSVLAARALRSLTSPRFSLLEVGAWLAALPIVTLPGWWLWRGLGAAAAVIWVTIAGSMGNGFACGYLSAAAWRPAHRPAPRRHGTPSPETPAWKDTGTSGVHPGTAARATANEKARYHQ